MRARYDWEAIRAGYEAGASRSELAGRYGVSGETIRKRIRAEGWTPDGSGIVNRAAGDPERDSAGSTACELPPGVAGTATARELPRNDAAEGAFCELPERGTVADATACESSDSAGTAFCELPESVAAPDRLAEARAAVITRHQREWDRHQGLVEEALSEGSLDKARLASSPPRRSESGRRPSARRGASWTGPSRTLLRRTVRPGVRISPVSPPPSCSG